MDMCELGQQSTDNVQQKNWSIDVHRAVRQIYRVDIGRNLMAGAAIVTGGSN